ncbi:hypothetical protein [Alistipes sp.]|uniref:hypothetical protein n=1 Tax=Alistipes sp. TaxID=1872444 RepID=UPI0025B97085|nr:hypothetical protein [Alistipes sp.]
MLGALVGSLGTSLISGAIDDMFSSQNQARNWQYKQLEMQQQQRYNERNMQKQFEYSTRAWQMQNEYNDPTNAVARWRAAGVAPQAVFGSSPGGSGVAGSLDTPDSSNPNASGTQSSRGYAPVMTPAEAINLRNQTKVADSQVKVNEANAAKIEAETEGQTKENKLKDTIQRIKDFESWDAQRVAFWDNIQQRLDAATKSSDLDLKAEMFNKIKQDINESKSREKLNDRQRANYDAVEDEIEARINNLNADTGNTRTDTLLKRIEVGFTKHRLSQMLLDIGISKTELDAKRLALIRNAIDNGDRSKSFYELAEKAASSIAKIFNKTISKAEIAIIEKYMRDMSDSD